MNQLTHPTVELYLKAKYARQSVPCRVFNGARTYLHGDIWIDEDSFNILYPVAEYIPVNEKGTNPCKKHLWMK